MGRKFSRSGRSISIGLEGELREAALTRVDLLGITFSQYVQGLIRNDLIHGGRDFTILASQPSDKVLGKRKRALG